MPITPVNKVKHQITPNNKGKAGYAFWGDDTVTWGDSGYGWGSPFASFVNKVKHLISAVNKVKN